MTEARFRSPATFSPCRSYRYSLWREWGEGSLGYAMFIGLNPSTADETRDDPTVRRCINFAKDWGFGALCMTNLFAFRATDPTVMKVQADPNGPENNATLKKLARDASVVVAAWGAHGSHMGRDKEVVAMLPGLKCLALTKDRLPKHPLYLLKTLRPMPLLS